MASSHLWVARYLPAPFWIFRAQPCSQWSDLQICHAVSAFICIPAVQAVSCWYCCWYDYWEADICWIDCESQSRQGLQLQWLWSNQLISSWISSTILRKTAWFHLLRCGRFSPVLFRLYLCKYCVILYEISRADSANIWLFMLDFVPQMTSPWSYLGICTYWCLSHPLLQLASSFVVSELFDNDDDDDDDWDKTLCGLPRTWCMCSCRWCWWVSWHEMRWDEMVLTVQLEMQSAKTES